MSFSTEILFNEESSGFWAEIILPLALPLVYTYQIPEHLKDKAKEGCRAEVVFGKNKKYAGIIKSIHQQKPNYTTKSIINVLDETPLLYPHQIKLWQWMSEYYMCSEGEVMAAALPSNFKLNSETIVVYNDAIGDDFSNLNDEEFIVAEALLIKKQLQLSEIQLLLDASHVYPVIKNLLEKEVCFTWEKLNEKYKPKKNTYVILNTIFSDENKLSALLNDWKGASKQMAILLAFIHLSKTEGLVDKKTLLEKANASSAQFNALCEKGILIAENRNIDRITTAPKNIIIDFELSNNQTICLAQLQQSFKEKKVTLLKGVTGSGKTLLYIKLIEAFIHQGKQVLYLLPEIALTTQIIRRLQKHFGGHVAVYHSKFNDQERIELWNKIRNGEVSIVLGARSSIFLPFNNLGFIIVDEEHDASFKQQDPAPRYNARDAAIYYASLFNATVLLGSGTPSLESYYNAMQKKYGYVELNERYGGIQLPAIEIINTRQVAQKGKVMISPQLKEAIQLAMDAEKQVILFQNRRGYNPYLICGSCGFIPQCNHCDVSLTLHKFSKKLHCHYCGSSYPVLIDCTACGSAQWIEKNFGTEKIEEQLEQDFSKYRIARMDVDSVRGKTAHDTLIQLFEQHRLDILVGTQMVVKGLDFDKVSLVGILDADGLLSFADFRVNERAFQLMEQVSGRAGRKGEQGKVIIQALNIKHPIIELVQQHNYEQFYANEIESRRIFNYPPFTRLIKLTLRHKENDVVKKASIKLSESLRMDFKESVVGPAPPVIARLRNQYLMEIMLKLPKETGMSLKIKKAIKHHINLLLSDKIYKSISIIADVDPS